MNHLPFHHIFWKQPFQMIRDITLDHNDKVQAESAITKFDRAVNRFDLPNNDQSAGPQGDRATIEAPYFEVLSYSVRFLRDNKVTRQDIGKVKLQWLIHNCPPRITLALTALEEFEGQQFIKALRNHILQLIPQIINGQIPAGFTAMIDYRYQGLVIPEDPSAQFNNLRTAIMHLLP